MQDAYIYGAGDYGSRLFLFVKESNAFNVIGYIQSEVQTVMIKENYPIYHVTDECIDLEAYILIAVADEISAQRIRLTLISKGFKNKKIINCSLLIRDNFPVEKKSCLICGCKVSTFLPGQVADSKLFREYNVVGAGYRKNMICPCCGCIDRNRWFYYVLVTKTDIFDKINRVLHIAPENQIKEKMKLSPNIDYYAVDLFPKNDEIKVDITDVPFKDNIFDYVIANHVMEHIVDEAKAISELKRVLKRDGKMILSFPICLDLKTIEKKENLSDEEKEELYGQRDHVRLYGYDYIEKISRYGLKITTYSPADEMDDEDIEMMGLIKEDIILICNKAGE